MHKFWRLRDDSGDKINTKKSRIPGIKIPKWKIQTPRISKIPNDRERPKIPGNSGISQSSLKLKLQNPRDFEKMIIQFMQRIYQNESLDFEFFTKLTAEVTRCHLKPKIWYRDKTTTCYFKLILYFDIKCERICCKRHRIYAWYLVTFLTFSRRKLYLL